MTWERTRLQSCFQSLQTTFDTLRLFRGHFVKQRSNNVVVEGSVPNSGLVGPSERIGLGRTLTEREIVVSNVGGSVGGSGRVDEIGRVQRDVESSDLSLSHGDGAAEQTLGDGGGVTGSVTSNDGVRYSRPTVRSELLSSVGAGSGPNLYPYVLSGHRMNVHGSDDDVFFGANVEHVARLSERASKSCEKRSRS